MRLLRCTNKRGAVATCTGEKSLFGQPYQNERSLATFIIIITFKQQQGSQIFVTQPASRTGLASASALATASPARLLRACARAHASTAHSARAQHACARLAGDAHALTRQHTLARQKLDVMLEALATGWPSAGWRLAHLARARCANASPPPLLARPMPMRHPHALPAIHHRCCHRVLRDHDDERDIYGDQRDDAEDREHD